MNELIYAWAITYHQAGWCVLPAKNKRPLVPWKEYQHERPSLDQVQTWFSEAPEDAQIALVTGKISGVTVIDVDTHKEGCASKRKLECDCNPESPEALALEYGLSLMSITGSGGRHVFCKYEDVGNSVGLAHPQLDIRSDGGIIILPPSAHKSGNNYAWDPMTKWSKEAIDTAIPFPPLLKVLLKNKAKVDWDVLISGVGEGSRNDSAASLAGKLLKTFYPDHQQAAWELLWLWNAHKNKPPLSDRELHTTFNSILKSEYGTDATSKIED